MENDLKHYKFINSETGNVIYFYSVSPEETNPEGLLEATRVKLASDNGIFVGNVYYMTSDDSDFEE